MKFSIVGIATFICSVCGFILFIVLQSYKGWYFYDGLLAVALLLVGMGVGIPTGRILGDVK
jgi:hypothetical protein